MVRPRKKSRDNRRFEGLIEDFKFDTIMFSPLNYSLYSQVSSPAYCVGTATRGTKWFFDAGTRAEI
jgi:hypothetical protein